MHISIHMYICIDKSYRKNAASNWRTRLTLKYTCARKITHTVVKSVRIYGYRRDGGEVCGIQQRGRCLNLRKGKRT